MSGSLLWITRLPSVEVVLSTLIAIFVITHSALRPLRYSWLPPLNLVYRSLIQRLRWAAKVVSLDTQNLAFVYWADDALPTSRISHQHQLAEDEASKIVALDRVQRTPKSPHSISS